MVADPGAFREELCIYFRFMTRSATYKDYPEFWKEKCLEYSRYMAYNMPDRDEAITYFDYLSQLEHYLNTHPEIQQQLPDCLKTNPNTELRNCPCAPLNSNKNPKRNNKY